MIQPIFLKWLLDVVAKEDLSKNKDAHIWAGALVASVFGQWLFIHPVFYWQEVLGAHCRSGALGVIYKKVVFFGFCFFCVRIRGYKSLVLRKIQRTY